MEPFEVVLPAPPQALSPNARVHWAKRYKAARDYKEECGWTLKALRSSARCPPLPLDKDGPVVAQVIAANPEKAAQVATKNREFMLQAEA